MNVRPLHDRLIIQRLEEGEQKVGGIIIPDTAKEKPQQGQVIAAGTGKVKDDGTRQRPDVKAGDRILFGKYAGQEVKLDGEEVLIMKEDDVLAIVSGETKKTATTKAKGPAVARGNGSAGLKDKSKGMGKAGSKTKTKTKSKSQKRR